MGMSNEEQKSNAKLVLVVGLVLFAIGVLLVVIPFFYFFDIRPQSPMLGFIFAGFVVGVIGAINILRGLFKLFKYSNQTNSWK
jgi:uncharacterized membrane protein HdeD (DUF308 family)